MLKEIENVNLSNLLKNWQVRLQNKLEIAEVKIGFELEFYFKKNPSPICIKQIEALNEVVELKKELGNLQYEVVSNVFECTSYACGEISKIKSSIAQIAKNHQNEAIFQAFISSELPPSSLQVSISFLKPNKVPITKNEMLQIVNSVLTHSNQMVSACLPTQNCFKRIANQELSQKFKNSPTHITWGTENRTTLVRLAKLHNGERLEFRLPSPRANPFLVVLCLFESIILGSLKNFLQTFINSFESSSERLVCNYNQARLYFKNSQMYKNIFGENVI